MKDISKRIAKLIDSLQISKSDFARVLNISPAYVSKITNSGSIPSDRLLEDICEKFNVNEDWLRTGTGEMFIIQTDDIAEQVSHLLEETNPFNNLIIEIMKSYQSLDPSGKKIIHDLILNTVDNIKKGD